MSDKKREPWEEVPLRESTVSRKAEAFLGSERVEKLLQPSPTPLVAYPVPGGGQVRQFDTGATRDADDGKYDYEGFLDPAVLEAFAKYMHLHRHQSDGGLRASDNWQKGIPSEQYMKSLVRHLMDLWLLHRGHEVVRPENGEVVTLEGTLGGLMFNVQGIWHNYLKES